MFEAGKREYLQQLHLELAEQKYVPQPTRLIFIQKNEKIRKIGLISMRDKVLQQSIQQELSKKYEPLFSDCCYAYRSRRSALQAVEKLDREIKGRGIRELWTYQGDITDFFENIDLDILLTEMESLIQEKEFNNLLRTCLFSPYITEDGEVRKKERGISIFWDIILVKIERKFR